MFDDLTGRLARIVRDLRGQGRLSEENIQGTLRELRLAFLEADVALPVVRGFIEHIRARAVGQEVLQSLTPGQALIRIVRDELTTLMGERCEELSLRQAPPNVVMVAGLQGSGKTTTVAKLARRLKVEDKKSVYLASCDVHRPAAIDQLAVLAREIGVDCFPADPKDGAVAIAEAALEQARKGFYDVFIVDTAGRLHIDSEMMDEVKRLHAVLDPIETLFVVDSMTGQDAATTARAFHEALPLTGVILTNLGLIEEVERRVDRQEAEKLAERLKKGQGFDLEDFRTQLKQMRGMGGIGGLMSKLPGVSDLPKAMQDRMDDKELVRLEAIIDSMTPGERRFPDVIKASRKRRISAGSGTAVQDVNRLLKQFTQIQKTMKRASKKGGLQKLMRAMGGRLPPGLPH
ncbi:MAG: signal recognition particle protein Srp54 [Beggiatoa sp.]|nr:signal recognition particle protein Srp54 [Beggiatoa sp.]